jgi:hypothetical protein
MFCDGAGGTIRSGHLKTCVRENFRKAAHADTADAHEVNTTGFREIYFVHNEEFLI